MSSLASTCPSTPTTMSPSPLSSMLPLDETSPMSPTPGVLWHPRHLEHSATAFQHTSATLFDPVRINFQRGISTLDNLLCYLETSGIAQCHRYRKGIDALLESLLNMARWLVAYVETAEWGEDDFGGAWTRSAILGLRLDLHQYSRKVVKVSKLLRGPESAGAEQTRKVIPLKGRPLVARLTTSWTESAKRSAQGPRMASVDCP